jgi:putative membrane protein
VGCRIKGKGGVVMMGYDHAGGGVSMWVFGGLLMAGVVVLIGLAVWAVLAATNRSSRRPIAVESSTAEVGGRSRTRQLLDERYARGEMDSEEYTERLHTLGL